LKSKEIGIVYLDDEENNLISFQATFRRDYNVWVTQSPQEAAEFIRLNDVHIVIADQKMPEVSGVEFLEMIRYEFQDPIRILLTGYADIEAVIDAINRGQVFRYIQKPWNEGELKVLFDSAYQLYFANKDLRLKNAELARAYSELEKFVYSASHDIKAPIATIQGLVKLAVQESDLAGMRECIDRIDISANKLSFFTNHLLGFYQTLRKPLDYVPVDFSEMWHQTLETARLHENFQFVRMTKEIQQNNTFFCDAEHLKAALMSLVVNSLKYINKSNPESYLAMRILSNESVAIIELEDNVLGLGNSQEQILEMVEGRDWVGSSAAIMVFMIKKIADKLNGQMQFNHPTNGGMTIKLTIPNHK